MAERKIFVYLVIIISILAAVTLYQGYSFNERLVEIEGEKQNLAPSFTHSQTAAVSNEYTLTSAVAAVSPAVVSIVASRDVPMVEVTYENPFGDSRLFGNMDLRIPVFRQRGSVPKKIGAGSGFVLSADGYVLTNRHVVSDSEAEYIVLLSTGRQLPARVVYRDAAQDIAVLKVNDNNLPHATLGSSKNLKLGQTVIAIGNALGEYNNSVSVGIISGLNRSIEASDPATGDTEILHGVIQTDAAINPGNSGGPLVDVAGRVIGMNVATIVGSNDISFAIPIDSVNKALKKLGG